MMLLSAALLLAELFSLSFAYPSFINMIPNGNKVPNPCDSTMFWQGVGHTNPMGGGQRNQFGQDFDRYDHVWNKALCQLDSDGDGKTNGEELGDPRCVWTFNLVNPQTPERTVGITNPGVCEPWNAEKCVGRQPWVKCQTAPCPAMTAPGVKSTSLNFPRTNIPAQETTYRCILFPLPNDDIYDVVATSASVSNSQVLHHLVLYSCTDPNITSSDMQPFDCPMGGRPGCTGVMVVWSKGFGDNCLSPEYGFRIGTSRNQAEKGVKFAVLQIHWTNSMLSSTLYDSSGLTLYYTPVLRPNKADILQIIQSNLFIPPKQNSFSDSVVCSSYCTDKSLKAPVNIVQGHVHMHLTGKKGSIIQKRNGTFLRYILNEHVYDYNSPEMMTLPTPIELRPGDEIVVNCVFDSSDRTKSTRFGPSTTDEMCIGFLVYYPAQEDPFQDCGESERTPYCQHRLVPVASCNLDAIASFVSKMELVCTPNQCTQECGKLVQAMEKSGCLSKAEGYNYLRILAYKVMDYIDACLVTNTAGCRPSEAKQAMEKMDKQCDYNCKDDCPTLNLYLKDTGCVQTPLWWALNRTNPDLSNTMLSCDRLEDQQQPASALKLLFPSALLPAILTSLVASFCRL